MYILFLPIKVSLYTCVVPFKVLQHHNNLCHLEEGSNLHSPFGIANTSRPVLILSYPTFGRSRLCFFLIVRYHLISHLPILIRATLPFAHQVIFFVGMTGLEPAKFPGPKPGALATRPHPEGYYALPWPL